MGISTKDLIQEISEGQNRKVFRQLMFTSLFMLGYIWVLIFMTIGMITTALEEPSTEATLLLIQTNIWILGIFLVIPLIMLILERSVYKIFMSDVGVGGNDRFGKLAAIRWENVRSVSVCYQDMKFMRIIIRSDVSNVKIRSASKSIMVDNSSIFGNKISLKTLSKYIDGVEEWKIRQKKGRRKGTIVYYNPLFSEEK